MTTQTPTQIATESMKGCGKGFILDDYPNSAPIEDFKCGNILSTQIELCPTCQKVNQTHKQDWEGELVKLDKYRSLTSQEKEILYDLITDDMNELTQALKILEGGK